MKEKKQQFNKDGTVRPHLLGNTKNEKKEFVLPGIHDETAPTYSALVV